jgi:hypothetical protein
MRAVTVLLTHGHELLGHADIQSLPTAWLGGEQGSSFR